MASSWESWLLASMENGLLQISEDAKFGNGKKYVVHPAIEFQDLEGYGSPISVEGTPTKGWIIPSNQELFQSLR